MGALLRVVWFCFVGWWLGPLWFLGSLAIMATVVLFPIGAYTAAKTWAVMTLKTSPKTIVVEAQQQN
ncbi:YccF domain-containing protein [Halomarina rubra]|uniref:YccF domain-containing protein n=1 Tax=Halomarina rubra TaxID=2071873 RepID=A0ABD6B1B2_9EURY|nr:YccF domain-containing protein [Halomarina rubra]